jgi:hypothetical protein
MAVNLSKEVAKTELTKVWQERFPKFKLQKLSDIHKLVEKVEQGQSPVKVLSRYFHVS